MTTEPQWTVLHDMDHGLDPECPYCQKERAAIQREWREWGEKAIGFIVDAGHPMHAADPERVAAYADELKDDWLALLGKTDGTEGKR